MGKEGFGYTAKPRAPALSARLSAVARWVPCPCRVADVGMGDGQLARWLAARGCRVIGTELKEGPYRRALAAVEGWEGIEVRRGDGLGPVSPGEVDAVVVAGLGGRTVVGILERGADTWRAARTLVLSPVQDPHVLRLWLLDRHAVLSVVAEDLVQEGRHMYPVEVVRVGPGKPPPEPRWLAAEVGPVLLETGHPLLGAYLVARRRHWEKVRQARDGFPAGDRMVAALEEVMGRWSWSGT